jgi:hypothetical protein
MAVPIPLESTSEELRKRIICELKMMPKKTQFNTDPDPIFVFSVNQKEGYIYIPMGSYAKYIENFPFKLEIPRIHLSPTFTLLTKETDPSGRGRDQDIAIGLALERLKKEHTVFMACHTGYGKTRCGIYLTCKLGYKTALLCHNDTIKNLWKDDFLETVPGIKVQIVKGDKPLDKSADVYIIGILKAKSLSREDTKHIGLVIIDEAHICTITAFTQSLLRFQPNYLIGLSATPERADGLQSLLTFYFGPIKHFIIREEVKSFTVVKYCTSYTPEEKKMFFKGEMVLAWTEMLTSLAVIPERTEEIANIALGYPTHKIIIICDRTVMCKNLFNLLTEKGDTPELYIENKKNWDRTKRILITTPKKGGVGLNDPSLTLLILAADMKNVKQCEGRIRTTNNIVIDVVDDYGTLENHWKIREKWYKKRGATIHIQTQDQLIKEPEEETTRSSSSGSELRFLTPLD